MATSEVQERLGGLELDVIDLKVPLGLESQPGSLHEMLDQTVRPEERTASEAEGPGEQQKQGGTPQSRGASVKVTN